MRVPLLLTAAILAAALGLGWQDRQRLARLRVDHARLAAQAVERGFSIDQENPAAAPRLSKRPRPDRAAEARQVAVSFLVYAKEMEAYQDERQAARENVDYSDPVLRRRMMDEMDRIVALDGDQLKILIGEIGVSQDIDAGMRERLLRFALDRLVEGHPHDAVMILTGTSGVLGQLQHTNGSAENAIFYSVEGWAKLDPDAALQWMREKAGLLSPELREQASAALILGIAGHDVRQALALIDEFGKNPSNFVNRVLVRDAQTIEQRNASLAAYREWRSAPGSGRLDEQLREGILSDLAFGNVPYRRGFEEVTGWVDQAGFSPEELDLLGKSLPGRAKSPETGRWLVWLDAKLPPASARKNAWELSNRWLDRDLEAAREWLGTTGIDTPAKHTAMRAWAEKLFSDQPEEAIRLALSVPPGEYRQITLGRLYERWPKDDEASREAAEAFARENGLLE